ncbi:penicillin-binding protein, partial [Bifidobacterium animalis subsp. lactis]|nr:penicillin-binding protein [Bifidobacterium animalis subsp. lactis]
ITINIDQKAQNKLYQLANNGEVPFTNDKMQIGATVVDPNNGHVVAILGGRHLPSVQLGLDRAVQTGRSTGSSIKPVLDYAPAIQYLNWSTAKMLDDSKYVYPGTNIQLYDWDNKYDGMMTMRKALEQSRNVPAVKTLADVGVKRASAFARRMGVDVPANSGLS